MKIQTTEGVMTVRLRPDVAPKTVENFLQYVRNDFYEGTVFHRVIPGFMIQGGGYTEDLAGKPTGAPVENEAKRTFGNVRGSVAMARMNDPDSATAQFFVNLVDNQFLDEGVRGPGYTVFGTVVEGMGVADAIASVPTTNKRGMADVPVDTVTIQSIEVVEAGEAGQP
ncbi:peptidylprolyl isomerase [Marinobacter fonticola]|uniref:peptidylprolyl isomerase n=1 Tax=Marinobacter fonticola TaxID=2603215 RepID=UPI001D0DA23B